MEGMVTRMTDFGDFMKNAAKDKLTVGYFFLLPKKLL